MSDIDFTTHSTPRILTEAPRDLVIAAQHDALDMFMFLRRNDPTEELRNRVALKRSTCCIAHAGRAAPYCWHETSLCSVCYSAVLPRVLQEIREQQLVIGGLP